MAEQILAGADFNWRVLRNTPQGMVHNWNFCIEQARGEFIKFLFQDDRLEPRCVAEMTALAQTDQNMGLVFCRRGLLVEQDIIRTSLTNDLIRGSRDVHSGWTQLYSAQAGISLLADPKLLHGNLNKVGEPSCVLLRKDVFYSDRRVERVVRTACGSGILVQGDDGV